MQHGCASLSLQLLLTTMAATRDLILSFLSSIPTFPQYFSPLHLEKHSLLLKTHMHSNPYFFSFALYISFTWTKISFWFYWTAIDYTLDFEIIVNSRLTPFSNLSFTHVILVGSVLYFFLLNSYCPILLCLALFALLLVCFFFSNCCAVFCLLSV